MESSKRSQIIHPTETLDDTFKKRFFALSSAEMEKRNLKNNNNTWKNTLENRDKKKLTLRKNTIKAIEHCRNSLFGSAEGLEKKKVKNFFYFCQRTF